MQSPGSIASAVGALSLSWGALLWAQQGSPAQTPVFRSGVEVVTVDVGVVDRQGLPLRGLAPADFVVQVNGQSRRVATAEFMDVAAERTSADAAAGLMPLSTNVGAAVGRLFVFIVDQNTLEQGQVWHVSRAASRFFSGLSFADRSALLLLPSGPNVQFTWAHGRVQEGLQRAVGLGDPSIATEFSSLSDARDIANRSMGALRSISLRECGNANESRPQGPTTPPPPVGNAPPGSTTGGSGTTTGGGSRGGSSGSTGGSFASDACTRDIQMRADSVWRTAQMMAHSSLTQLRQTLANLGRVQGEKTVILISGGWPLDDREQSSMLSAVAAEAAAARATVFTLFVASNQNSASRRMMSTTPVNDQWLYSRPLETLAGMTGGGSFRVDVAAESAFERLGKELSGYYRIGVEKAQGDEDGKPRRMTVQVSRGGVIVRAREMFDVRTYDDRNVTARLAAAVDAPIASTGIPLRVTSYLAADPQDTARLKLVVTGEASRVDPGEATVRLLVNDMAGTKVLEGEQAIGEPTADGLAFSANLPLPPGEYMVRVAVMDGTGRVGSVDHRATVRQAPLGPLFATGPLLVRAPRSDGAPRIAVNAVRQDERLALQIDLEGERSHLEGAEVTFEIAATADGPSLVSAAADLSRDTLGTFMLAQTVADVRVLPAGSYVVRAKVASAGGPLGELRRGFIVTAATATAPSPADGAIPPGDAARPSVPRRSSVRAAVAIPRFTLDQALARPVLGPFLDRVAARPDAASPMIRELVENARTAGLDKVVVSDTLAAEYPVAAFLRGLALLSQKKLDHAANAFRGAMRASPDFYPAMVYLGVCYAAGGKDKEAAGAWRTALIKEGDTQALHVLLADALLRQERADLALQTLVSARARWPADDGLKRRLVLASLLSGEYAGGFRALDELVAANGDDEPTLLAALLVLYTAFEEGQPIDDVEQDKARMVRLASAYRAHGGPSLALVDAWVAQIMR